MLKVKSILRVRKMDNIARLAFVVTMMVLVSGCDAFDSFTKPGAVDESALDPSAYQYKGAADPLSNVSAADRADDLADRFDLIQGRQ